jgi:hypothetical protein
MRCRRHLDAGGSVVSMRETLGRMLNTQTTPA